MSLEQATNKEIVERLDKIVQLLTPAPTPPAPKGMKNEFMTFLLQYKVLGLAVAFIMGLYLGAVVKSLVTDFILPLIGLAIPGLANLTTFAYPVGKQMFAFGDFLSSVITFIIVAFVIFLIVKVATKWGLNK